MEPDIAGSAQPVVEKLARLFEAGDYPDKNLSVSERELETMASSFSEPVPIRVEHTRGPLRLGWLVKVWVDGRQLLGKLAFTRAAWELMRECRASALSVGLDPETLAIQEVSLVRRPRVAGAGVFGEAPALYFSVEITDGGSMKTENNKQQASIGFAAPPDAKARLELLKSRGKVCPAAEQYALALLTADANSAVEFADEGRVDVASLFLRFLEAQGPVVVFGELAPAGGRSSRFGEQEQKLFRAMGLTEDEVLSLTGQEGQ